MLVRKRQDVLRLLEVRSIDHLAIDLQHADARIGGKGVDNRLRARRFLCRGVKAALIGATCDGWIAIIPVKPSRRARAA